MSFVEEATRYLALASSRLRGSSTKASSLHLDDKLRALGSYARFCKGETFPDYPLEVFLEISNICDLKCGMCVQFSALNPNRLDTIKTTPRGFMNQNEVSENLREALQHALLVHCFGYGEPTIHPTFRSFLEFISGYEVMIDFFTNGMHLDDDFCRFLVDRHVYQITVSFSGATRETYEGIYLGGDFEKVLGGIKRLAEAKRTQRSPYPRIEINSLGFRDHVERFDEFVALMAAHGADIVTLKPLQAHTTIPQLYEHVSIMRPDHEGVVVDRAIKAGRRLGVQVHADLYVQQAARDDRDYEGRMADLRATAEKSKSTGRGFGGNPVSDFARIAAEIEPRKASHEQRRDPKVLDLNAPREVCNTLLDVRAPDSAGAPPGYCMEPFKTLYVSRNGAAKPCCFADPNAWYLGNVKRDRAIDVWRGAGFDATREAIVDGQYPNRTCGTCLRKASGPQGHLTATLIGNYVAWHGHYFRDRLGERIRRDLPAAMSLIGRTSEAVAVAARRRPQPAAAAGDETPEWPLGPVSHDAGMFASVRGRFAHRSFLPDDSSIPRTLLARPGEESTEFLKLLFTIGRGHYRGGGLIVDLGMLPEGLCALLAGLRENPGYRDMVERHSGPLLQRYGLSAGTNDVPDPDNIVERRIIELGKMKAGSSMAIELALLEAGRKGRPFQAAFAAIADGLVPGRSLLVLRDFYTDHAAFAQVLWGHLSGSVEWMGQVGGAAILRLLAPLPRQVLAIEPYRDLPLSVCLQFQRQWCNPSLALGVRMGLELSHARLLAEKGSPEAARAFLDDWISVLRKSGDSRNESVQRRLARFERWLDQKRTAMASAQ